jgi:hypothetical protein
MGKPLFTEDNAHLSAGGIYGEVVELAHCAEL